MAWFIVLAHIIKFVLLRYHKNELREEPNALNGRSGEKSQAKGINEKTRTVFNLY